MLDTTPNDRAKHKDLSQGLASFYSNLSLSVLPQLKVLYSEDIVFIDPVGIHKGLSSLTHYFQRLLVNCSQCRSLISSLFIDSDGGYIQWSMTFAHPRLNNGNELEINGISVLKIKDNKITYQRDFYDMGAMIYEHLPVIGTIIKFLRKRMA
ncbi:transcriptional regulator [Tenacibaculum sp. KUL113]|uniref:nuclear transport factor 2 family protein n=1 Tax=Alteromonas sp. KUL150 TaxID=2480805 RepID=UPI0012E66FF4|nr:nuclear transport factor 2 family protein [Alteromonas sp. KUL150]GFD72392.1 transcriptional regulator [Tenacibaculum sp. KUL113]GFD85819.1 transcriptional regulator [Alteromonas sp. KUL150]